MKKRIGAIVALLISGGTSCTTSTLSGSSTATAGSAGFAPYVTVSSSGNYDMAATAEATGTDRFTLGFVVSDGGCAAKWDGTDGLANPSLDKRVSALRSAGGDIGVSFGGQDGSELALACDSTGELAAAYATVIDRYNLTEADFDIEGDALTDTAANTRRAKAIAQLQKEATAEGRTPDISFTLPAMPDGLTADAVAFLKNAEANGVDISAVNIMAMDYGSEYTGDMGGYATQAATAAQAQLMSILGLSDTAAWQTLAVTPMIGVNDIPAEVFRVSDAGQLAAFAARRGLGRLSMWSADRDTSSLGFTKAMSGGS
jgi:chitinase